MSEKKQETSSPKAPVKIILIGLPKAVKRAITIFHCRKFVKACNWIEVKHTKDPDELTMTITLWFNV